MSEVLIFVLVAVFVVLFAVSIYFLVRWLDRRPDELYRAYELPDLGESPRIHSVAEWEHMAEVSLRASRARRGADR